MSDAVRELESVLAMLRRQNVQTYEDETGKFKVTFFAPPVELPKDSPKSKDAELGLDTCKCGHFTYEHGPQGDCLKGCPPDKCAPEEK